MNDQSSAFRNAMSREEFAARWAEHLKTYGLTKQTAGAYAEQNMGDLFARSGWTQEDIAKEVGLAQQRVFQLLTFGRFLDFTTGVVNANSAPLKHPLTEKRFRSFWATTKEFKGNDRQRFRATWEAILGAEQDEAAGNTRKPPRDFKPLRQQLGKKFSDGKWHAAETIADHLDTDIDTVADMIGGAKKFRLGEFPYEVEQKPVGRSVKYRLFKQDKQLSLQKVQEELAPILEGLITEGKKSPVTCSPGTVARLAHQLKKLLEQWGE